MLGTPPAFILSQDQTLSVISSHELLHSWIPPFDSGHSSAWLFALRVSFPFTVSRKDTFSEFLSKSLDLLESSGSVH